MLRSIRTKLLVFSFVLTLITVIPILVAVNVVINKSTRETYHDNVVEKASDIEEILQVFYDNLDQNLNTFATHPKILRADNTITSYAKTTQKTAMTPSQNGGIEQQIYEEFEHYANNHPGTMYVYLAPKTGDIFSGPRPRYTKAMIRPKKDGIMLHSLITAKSDGPIHIRTPSAVR